MMITGTVGVELRLTGAKYQVECLETKNLQELVESLTVENSERKISNVSLQ